jgi:signal peptidase II
VSRDAQSEQPTWTRRTGQIVVYCLVATVVLTALDLASKEWAVAALSRELPGEPPPVCEPDERGYTPMQRARAQPVVLIEGYLEFRYAENCGAAFGLMNDMPGLVRHTVFGLAAILASVALLWMFVQGRGGWMFAASVPLIVSGALGNLVDRVRYGYVVDFIRFHLQDQWDYPTFNVADSTITVGVILLLLDGIFEARREKAAAQAQQARTAKS